MNRIFRIAGTAVLLALVACSGRKLSTGGWVPEVRDALNAMMAEYGSSSKTYDKNVRPYAVFDFDNTTIIGDIEITTMTYQIERLRFKILPENLAGTLRGGLGNFNPDSLVSMGGNDKLLSVNMLISDLEKDYAYLYDNYISIWLNNATTEAGQAFARANQSPARPGGVNTASSAGADDITATYATPPFNRMQPMPEDLESLKGIDRTADTDEGDRSFLDKYIEHHNNKIAADTGDRSFLDKYIAYYNAKAADTDEGDRSFLDKYIAHHNGTGPALYDRSRTSSFYAPLQRQSPMPEDFLSLKGLARRKAEKYLSGLNTPEQMDSWRNTIAERQSDAAKLLNGTVKMAALAGTTFLDNTIGLAVGLGTASSVSGGASEEEVSSGILADRTFEKICQSIEYKDFIAKMWLLCEGIYENAEYSAGCVWIDNLFANMNRAELTALTKEAADYALGIEAPCQVTWISPDRGVCGEVSISFMYGLGITEQMRELYNTLRANGIDVYICSASDEIILEAVACGPKYGINVPEEKAFGLRMREGGNGSILADFDPDYIQTYREGKVAAIKEYIAPLHGGNGPVLVAGDSNGDYAMLTSFPDLKIGLIINCGNGGAMGKLTRQAIDAMEGIEATPQAESLVPDPTDPATAAVFSAGTLTATSSAGTPAAASTLYLVQGRDPGLRTLIPTYDSVPLKNL